MHCGECRQYAECGCAATFLSYVNATRAPENSPQPTRLPIHANQLRVSFHRRSGARHNEDCVAAWEPQRPDRLADRGAIVILGRRRRRAGRGEVASRSAFDTAVKTFLDAKPLTTPTQVLCQMFTAANIASMTRTFTTTAAARWRPR